MSSWETFLLKVKMTFSMRTLPRIVVLLIGINASPLNSIVELFCSLVAESDESSEKAGGKCLIISSELFEL